VNSSLRRPFLAVDRVELAVLQTLLDIDDLVIMRCSAVMLYSCPDSASEKIGRRHPAICAARLRVKS